MRRFIFLPLLLSAIFPFIALAGPARGAHSEQVVEAAGDRPPSTLSAGEIEAIKRADPDGELRRNPPLPCDLSKAKRVPEIVIAFESDHHHPDTEKFRSEKEAEAKRGEIRVAEEGTVYSGKFAEGSDGIEDGLVYLNGLVTLQHFMFRSTYEEFPAFGYDLQSEEGRRMKSRAFLRTGRGGRYRNLIKNLELLARNPETKRVWETVDWTSKGKTTSEIASTLHFALFGKPNFYHWISIKERLEGAMPEILEILKELSRVALGAVLEQREAKHTPPNLNALIEKLDRGDPNPYITVAALLWRNFHWKRHLCQMICDNAFSKEPKPLWIFLGADHLEDIERAINEASGNRVRLEKRDVTKIMQRRVLGLPGAGN